MLNFQHLTANIFGYLPWIKSILSSVLNRYKKFDGKTIEHIGILFNAMSNSELSEFDKDAIFEVHDGILKLWIEPIGTDFISNAKLSSIHFNHTIGIRGGHTVKQTLSTLY